MKIRSSRPDDAPRLLAVWCAAVDATHGFLAAADRRAIEAEVVGYVARAAFLVAEEEGCVLGFIGATGGHVDALFVDPAAHGRGIGRRLLAAGEFASVDVNEANAGATGFYERLGFRRIGRSATDDAGRPYPILHLRRAATSKLGGD